MYGSIMIKKTRILPPQAIIAGTINLTLGLFSIIGWLIFTWGVRLRVKNTFYSGDKINDYILYNKFSARK